MYKKLQKALLLILTLAAMILLSTDVFPVEINPEVAVVFSETSYIVRNMTSELEGVTYL